MTATTNATPKPQSAILLTVCIVALLAAETYWLLTWHRSNEALLMANVRRAGQNTLDEHRILELRSAAVRIDGLYLRLQDPLTPPAPSAQQIPSSVAGARPNSAEPMVIQDFVKGGLTAVPLVTMRTEASVGYQLGSDRLEFHRLVPLIAQEENSNVFFFIDHLEFVRPWATGPFSLKPTALQIRFTARMFTSSTK
jgi:hypothetical protein